MWANLLFHLIWYALKVRYHIQKKFVFVDWVISSLEVLESTKNCQTNVWFGFIFQPSDSVILWFCDLFCLLVHMEFPSLIHWDSIATSDLHLLGPSNSFWTIFCAQIFTQRQGSGKVPLTVLRGLYKYKPHFHKIALRDVGLTSLAVWQRNWDTGALSKTGASLGPRRSQTSLLHVLSQGIPMKVIAGNY